MIHGHEVLAFLNDALNVGTVFTGSCQVFPPLLLSARRRELPSHLTGLHFQSQQLSAQVADIQH